MHMMHGSGNFFTMLFMGALWIGLVVFGIYLTVYFIRGDQKERKNTDVQEKSKDDSLRILNERLAKGEIDEAEYERLRSIINEENNTSS